MAGASPALARDAALRRISSTRRWILVATAALTAGLAALASVLLPGKAKSPTATAAPTRATATASTATPQLPAPATGSQLGLGAPAQALQSAPSNQAAPQSAPSSQAAPQPAPQPAAQPTPQPVPAPSGGGGAVVSGGS
jgi:hypothetical protein